MFLRNYFDCRKAIASKSDSQFQRETKDGFAERLTHRQLKRLEVLFLLFFDATFVRYRSTYVLYVSRKGECCSPFRYSALLADRLTQNNAPKKGNKHFKFISAYDNKSVWMDMLMTRSERRLCVKLYPEHEQLRLVSDPDYACGRQLNPLNCEPWILRQRSGEIARASIIACVCAFTSCAAFSFLLRELFWRSLFYPTIINPNIIKHRPAGKLNDCRVPKSALRRNSAKGKLSFRSRVSCRKVLLHWKKVVAAIRMKITFLVSNNVALDKSCDDSWCMMHESANSLQYCIRASWSCQFIREIEPRRTVKCGIRVQKAIVATVFSRNRFI